MAEKPSDSMASKGHVVLVDAAHILNQKLSWVDDVGRESGTRSLVSRMLIRIDLDRAG
jgi:hypothetical protein